MTSRFKLPGIFFASFALAASLPLHRVRAAPPEGKKIQISAKRFSFDPGEVTLKKGEPVTLVLHSDDVAHGLRIRELGLDLRAGKGESAQATVTPDKTGDFVGHCSTFCGPGHGSMALTVHVLP